MRDVALGDGAGLVEGFEPARLADAILRRPARFDMHGRDDVLPGGIAAIVGRQIVAAERREIAETTRPIRARGEPGMAAEAEVPQVMVGIDDRTGIKTGHVLLRPNSGA